MSNEIEAIKSRLNVVDIVSKYVDLKKAGANYKGLCPFHSEKSPSFIVNPTLQIYKCFGCGKGGDLINFIEEIDRVDFPDALKKAAEMAGIELSKTSNAKYKKEKELKTKIYEVNLLAAKFYHHLLTTHKAGSKARIYARKRLLTKKEVVDFMFGYALEGFENLKKFLIKKGYSEKDLIAWGLLVERNGRVFDKFRDRLLQPIFNVEGNILGFSGRYIGNEEGPPKYLNSSDSPVFKKNEILYGLYNAKESARKQNFIIIVEGNIDVASSYRVGVENIVAPLGTAFTTNQAKLLKRFVDSVYFCFDNDSAGFNALVKSVKIVEEMELDHKVINLGEYKDCDELISADPNLWEDRVKTPIDTYEFVKSKLAKGLDLGSADGKYNLYKNLLPVLLSIKNPIKLSHYVKDLALVLDIKQETLENSLKTQENIKPVLKDSKPGKKNKTVLDLEKHLLALMTQFKVIVNIKDPEKVFSESSFIDLYEILKETKGELGMDIVKTLDESHQAIFKEIEMVDLSYVEDPKSEIEKIYWRLVESKIRKRIGELRDELKLRGEDEDLAEELNKMIDSLHKIRRND